MHSVDHSQWCMYLCKLLIIANYSGKVNSRGLLQNSCKQKLTQLSCYLYTTIHAHSSTNFHKFNQFVMKSVCTHVCLIILLSLAMARLIKSGSQCFIDLKYRFKTLDFISSFYRWNWQIIRLIIITFTHV